MNLLLKMFGGFHSFFYFCIMKEEGVIREIIFSNEFEEYYSTLSPKLLEKYRYALNIISTQLVVCQKFVKHLTNTDFYELRISISKDEYRTVLFTVDTKSFMESRRILVLNSFMKKGTKQYKSEIKLAEKLLKKYLEE